MDSTQIIVKNLSVSKNGADILKKINLQFFEGNSYLLYGRNGAGKTTFIKSIVGLQENYQGDINFNLKDSTALRISYLPEVVSISEHIKVKDYINSFIFLYKNMVLFNEDHYINLSEIFEINKYKNKTFGSLSKGMKKMVLICISFMKESDVLVLDEPFEGLDIVIKEKLSQFLLNEIKKGKILIISSHEIAEVYDRFDYVIGMKAGRITAIADREINRDYQHLLTQI
jgi:ABC-2 type transport system ATP-binding protein